MIYEKWSSVEVSFIGIINLILNHNICIDSTKGPFTPYALGCLGLHFLTWAQHNNKPKYMASDRLSSYQCIVLLFAEWKCNLLQRNIVCNWQRGKKIAIFLLLLAIKHCTSMQLVKKYTSMQCIKQRMLLHINSSAFSTHYHMKNATKVEWIKPKSILCRLL